MSSMADLQRKLKAQQFLDKATKAAERGSLDIALTLCPCWLTLRTKQATQQPIDFLSKQPFCKEKDVSL